ncbi:MAG: hypothetical protein IJS68_03360 [Clostridia bacterium]|nr:hypothetical protein [Clostridia bacterium]
MLLRKIFNKPRVTKSKVKITSFENGLNLKPTENILPLSYAQTTYNYSFSSGGLEDGLGIIPIEDALYEASATKSLVASELAGLGDITNAYFSKMFDQDNSEHKDKIAFLCNGKLYLLPIKKNYLPQNHAITELSQLSFSGVPVAINYRLNSEDCTIFTSPQDSMIVLNLDNTFVVVVADAPCITSMALHYERLWATTGGEQTRVWFSDDLDPTNFSVGLDDAGFIDMLDERGALKKVISFNDYVYVFRDYGITRISAYADQKTFQVTQLFVASGKICPGSVCVCGDEIIFLASDGLYSFDGLNCRKILNNISKGFDDENSHNVQSAYYENKYYLACNFNFGDGALAGENAAKNNCLIEVDLNTRTATFLRGADISSLSTCLSDEFEGVVVCAKALGGAGYKLGVVCHNGKIFGTSTTKVWKTPLTDYGYPQKIKCAKSLTINTASSINVVIKNENGESATLSFNGSNAPQTKNFKLLGSKFSFSFISQSTSNLITNPNVQISMSDRG